MDLINKLTDWTYNTVVEIVRKYEYESGSFDYKGVLVPQRTDPTKDEFNASVRRTVCSIQMMALYFGTTKQLDLWEQNQ